MWEKELECVQGTSLCVSAFLYVDLFEHKGLGGEMIQTSDGWLRPHIRLTSRIQPQLGHFHCLLFLLFTGLTFLSLLKIADQFVVDSLECILTPNSQGAILLHLSK